MQIEALFGELRSCLDTPGYRSWGRIMVAVEEVDDVGALTELVVPYLLGRLEGWPMSLALLVPEGWYEEEMPAARREALLSLAHARCPTCGARCRHEEVADSLLALRGELYEGQAREVMRGDGQERWACGACRAARCPCPFCHAEKGQGEVLEALREIEARDCPFNGISAGELALDITMRQGGARKTSYTWACLGCLEDDEVWGQVRMQNWVRRPWRDRQLVCRQCQAPFVFSGQEHRRWFERYGFEEPDTVVGVPIVRKRCDRCQREHIVGRRVDELKGEGALDVARHRELAWLYRLIGAAERAEAHRQEAARLDEG